MAQHHILKLISEGEHQLLDFKFGISDAHKIAKSLSAFANTDGGRLLIGVKDNGAIAGVRSDEEYFMLESAATMYCRPPVFFQFKQWVIQGKTILEVIIPKSDQRPHYAGEKEDSWKAFIRVYDQNFPVNRILLQVWKREKLPQGVYLKFTGIEKFLLNYLEEHPSITLSQFIRFAGISRHRAEQILIRFILLKFIEIRFTENQTLYELKQVPKA